MNNEVFFPKLFWTFFDPQNAGRPTYKMSDLQKVRRNLDSWLTKLLHVSIFTVDVFLGHRSSLYSTWDCPME